MFVKKSGATFALLFALSVAITQRLQASTVTVVPSEVQTQIQASINNSQVGDTISFQAGTYNLFASACRQSCAFLTPVPTVEKCRVYPCPPSVSSATTAGNRAAAVLAVEVAEAQSAAAPTVDAPESQATAAEQSTDALERELAATQSTSTSTSQPPDIPTPRTCTTSGPTVTVSLGANIQAAINSASPGTTLVFSPGTWRIASTIYLASGVSLQGQSGTRFQYGGADPMFDGDTVSNINICGINFDGGSSGGGANFPSAAILIAASSSIHIVSNTFTNNSTEGDVVMFDSDNIYFQGNVSGPNEREVVAGQVTDGKFHDGIFVTDNYMRGFSRMGVELQNASSYSVGFGDVHVDRNTFEAFGSYTMATSFVTGALNICNTFWGNTIYGTRGAAQWGLEIGIDGTATFSIEQNRMTNVDGPFFISGAPGGEIENNTITNFGGSYGDTAFNKDGGFNGTEWIGTNELNGVLVTGDDGGLRNRPYGAQPTPLCTPSPVY